MPRFSALCRLSQGKPTFESSPLVEGFSIPHAPQKDKSLLLRPHRRSRTVGVAPKIRWSPPRVELDLPAVAKPYSLLFTMLSFTTESTEHTDILSVLSVFSVVIMP